ncbi:hypothetical protein OF83DRAFT_1176783 [Amylostereum chailletii]|nr:hypothetical protein OF83DRAFT_1176783 [Amylostereum chailletii]
MPTALTRLGADLNANVNAAHTDLQRAISPFKCKAWDIGLDLDPDPAREHPPSNRPPPSLSALRASTSRVVRSPSILMDAPNPRPLAPADGHGIRLPDPRVLGDTDKDAQERADAFRGQTREFVKRLAYAFFIPVMWYFTFLHAAARVAKRIVLLPLSISLDIYERQIRAWAPALPSVYGTMNAHFPNGIAVPSWSTLAVALSPQPPEDDIPPLEVDMAAIAAGAGNGGTMNGNGKENGEAAK